MKKEKNFCPNCQRSLGTRMSQRTIITDENIISAINEFCDSPPEIFCSECGHELINQAKWKIQTEKEENQNIILDLLDSVIILSSHLPLNWDYTSLSIVTAQTTTGTGVVAEIASGLTDFFGAQSGVFNKKIALGEKSCFSQLKKKTLDLGGNAIIAADIDYSDIGASKGMIMVCMTGTAVKLHNPEIVSKSLQNNLNQLIKAHTRNKYLESIENTAL